MALNFWRSLPTKIKRILTVATFFLLSIIITVAGTLTPLSDEEINILGKQLDDTQQTIDSMPAMQQASFIFGNNFMICLVGFVPIIGSVFECYVLYSTGVVISAYSSYETIQTSPLLLFFFLFLLPFTWLEFLAYSTAMAESVWLTWRIIQRKGRKELVNACILISICALMLLMAAIIELTMISYFGGL